MNHANRAYLHLEQLGDKTLPSGNPLPAIHHAQTELHGQILEHVGHSVTIRLEPGEATEEGQFVEETFTPTNRIVELSCHMRQGSVLEVEVEEGEGVIELIDATHLYVSDGIVMLGVKLEDETGKEVAAGRLQTGTEVSTLRLQPEEEGEEEMEFGELVELYHSFEEAEERKREAEEQQDEALEELAKQERERGEEVLHEKGEVELEEEEHHHGQHNHEHTHEHAHHEHGYSIDAKFDPETRTISFVHVMEDQDCKIEITVQSGTGTITRKEGDMRFSVSQDVKSVHFVIRDKKGDVVLEGTLPTNGKASELHVQKAGAHHSEGHGEQKHDEKPHEKKGHKDHHESDEQGFYGVFVDEEIVELANAEDDGRTKARDQLAQQTDEERTAMAILLGVSAFALYSGVQARRKQPTLE
jgi:hypothetical protein